MHYNGGYLIGQINKLTNRRVNELLKERKITEFNGAQGTILYVLWDRKKMTIKDICKATGLAKTSLTSMLDRMEAQGLVAREEDKEDRRCTIVSLTEKSQQYKEAIESVATIISDEYYRGMSNSEIAYFEDTLHRILNNLEE
ncbi:MAG: MarR family transcriptional regulator [Erysipelotrichaceae bacterium]|jgi:DNA-binding MarR family transcriptional regulator|nr:MarR family transcriptional regulator [Erysipelotrichaceae bacterium]